MSAYYFPLTLEVTRLIATISESKKPVMTHSDKWLSVQTLEILPTESLRPFMVEPKVICRHCSGQFGVTEFLAHVCASRKYTSSSTVSCPEAQGSTRAFIPKGWNRPVITAASKKQKPWRQEVTRAAIEVVEQNGGEIIPRETSVCIRMDFYLRRPASKPKRITRPTTKPDCDKLARLIFDSLTGIIFEDDSQICDAIISKNYRQPERVEITVASGNEVSNRRDVLVNSLRLFEAEVKA